MNFVSSRLKDLDFVWRPMQLKLKDAMEERCNLRRLNTQLKQSTPFIKYVTKTLEDYSRREEVGEEEQEFHCFTMLYNFIEQDADQQQRNGDVARPGSTTDEDYNTSDEYYEEGQRPRPPQWTAVISTLFCPTTQELSNTVMVLKAPDSLGQFTKESLVSLLDIAEAIGCEKVCVAINKNMEPAAERLQIMKAFMYVGFQVQHPSVMSVDGHVLLGYEF